MPAPRLLLVDNYDSFSFTLVDYLRVAGADVEVVRNDAVSADQLLSSDVDGFVISPGPGRPESAGISVDLARSCLASKRALLGVCLGHQTIAAALGGKIVRAAQPMHGRISLTRHTGRGVFAGLSNPLTVGRYHSLVVEENTLPAELEITARTDDGVVMALAHRRWPVVGVQFHPESILTEGGYALLANFLRLAGLEPADVPAGTADERPLAPAVPTFPARPVTF